MARLGTSIAIRGDLTGDEDLVIDGRVEGKVDLPNGQLTIGVPGTVKGQIRAQAVIIIGRLQGNVTATDRIGIQGTGTVEGDVTAPRLVVSEGAVINGSIQMTKPLAENAAASSVQTPPVAGGSAPGPLGSDLRSRRSASPGT